MTGSTDGSLLTNVSILPTRALMADYTGRNAGENAPTREKLSNISPASQWGPLYTPHQLPMLMAAKPSYGHYH